MPKGCVVGKFSSGRAETLLRTVKALSSELVVERLRLPRIGLSRRPFHQSSYSGSGFVDLTRSPNGIVTQILVILS